jgi:MbtH protein
MRTNPFDDDDRGYLVLVNAQNQPSLWPADIPVPPGWRTARAEGTRQACIDHVDARWTNPRPASLIESAKDS